MTELEARSIRYGIYQSMLDIRRQLMVSGEWDDPTVLPLHVIHRRMMASHAANTDVSNHARHTNSLRWVMRQERKRRAS